MSPPPSRGPSFEDDVRRRLERVAELDRDVHSLVLLDPEAAVVDARRLDAVRASGGEPGPLAGLVVVVKDNIDVAGQVTACGSRAHDGRVAATDAPVVARLRAAGGIVLGRANMDELAMGASTATSAFGITRNPWDHQRSPGGSSGGCAAAVALGLADLAVGTDTGGSVREPAAQCGVLGLAPSPGLVPTRGVVPFAPSCDRVGPIASSPEVLAGALAVMAGQGRQRLPDPREGHPLRVGLVRELSGAANQAGVRRRLADVVETLTATGARVEEVSLPDAPRALAAYLDLTSAAAARQLGDWLDSGLTGREATRRLMLGRRLLRAGSTELAAAAAVRARLRQQVRLALQAHHVLLSPTLPTTAPRFAPAGPPTADVADPMSAPYTDCWSVVANLAGVPALSVPAGLSPEDQMPVGAMLMAAPGDDAQLLSLAASLAGASTGSTGTGTGTATGRRPT